MTVDAMTAALRAALSVANLEGVALPSSNPRYIMAACQLEYCRILNAAPSDRSGATCLQRCSTHLDDAPRYGPAVHQEMLNLISNPTAAVGPVNPAGAAQDEVIKRSARNRRLTGKAKEEVKP